MHAVPHAMRFSLVYVALFATHPAMACQNAAVLQSPFHLELGVRFSTHDPRLVQEATRALDRWSEIADMSWHQDNSNNCSIEIKDGAFTVADEIAEAKAKDGSITFANASELTANELFATAFHEIGHLLGLQHNPSPHSVMYWIDIRGDEVLDGADMRALAAKHAVRKDSGCARPGSSCEILSRVTYERKPDHTRRTSGISMARQQGAPLQPKASGSQLRSHVVRIATALVRRSK